MAADFPTQISRTWNASLLSLVNLGKALVLWVVNWALWIPVLLVFAVLGWILLRWLIRFLLRNLPPLIALARTPITQPRARRPVRERCRRTASEIFGRINSRGYVQHCPTGPWEQPGPAVG